MRKAKVLFDDKIAGIISENENGYMFKYLDEYVNDKKSEPISLTLPLRTEPYIEKKMFSFFDGLIPEGWLLDIAENNWKLNIRDRMGLLINCCKECIGAVSVIKIGDDYEG